MILVDAGPLVALFHRDDTHHALCVETLASLREPLRTAWPALTEAMHLLRSLWPAQEALLETMRRGAIDVLPLTATDIPRIRDLMAQYRDLPMDLADAALVRLAERERISRVFTLDRRDFTVYRPAGVGTLTLVPSSPAESATMP